MINTFKKNNQIRNKKVIAVLGFLFLIIGFSAYQAMFDSTKFKPESGSLFVDKEVLFNDSESTPTATPAATPTPILSYILTYVAGSGGTISGNTNQTVKSGENGTLVTATPNSGYYFTSWSDGLTINPRTDITITANKSLTANFAYRYNNGGSSPSVTTYTVTFNTNGGDGGSTTTQTLNYNTPTNLTTNGFTRAGYSFTGWNTASNGSGTDYANQSSYTIGAGNVTLFARWTAISQTLTFEGNGGSAVAAITQDFGTAIVAPTAPTKSGYTFDNWYNEVGLTTIHAFDTMGLSTTVYAKWTALTPITTIDAIAGTATVGSVLTAGALTPAEATVSYQWQSANSSGGTYSNIDGATSNTYTLVSADLGKYIKVVATGTGSYTETITSTATAVILGDISFTYNGNSIIYGTVYNATTARVWLDRNLGATQVATAFNDTSAYGGLFQWGRPDDGHQLRNSGTQTGQVATITPGTNTFIIDNSEWSSADNNGALRSAYLAKTDGTGICPTGFRVPTETELNAERVSWSTSDIAGAFASPLKLTANGNRYFYGGVSGGGDRGDYWTSTVINAKSRGLYFHTSGFLMQDQDRANGFAVRCIKD